MCLCGGTLKTLRVWIHHASVCTGNRTTCSIHVDLLPVHTGTDEIDTRRREIEKKREEGGRGGREERERKEKKNRVSHMHQMSTEGFHLILPI